MDSKSSPGEEATQTLKKTEEKATQALTALWNELPQWMKDNHYIQSGYRPPSNSYWKSAASLGYLHNESVNIWTHLIGAALAGCAATVLYTTVRPRFKMATPEDVMVFSCFFLGAMACLGMSATYHTISNHSESVAKFGNRLDYIGIVVLIWGSFISSIYYGFSAEPGLIRLYWTMVSYYHHQTRNHLCSHHADHDYWGRNTDCGSLSEVQISRMATFPGLHVRRDGSERRGTRYPWTEDVRLQTT